MKRRYFLQLVAGLPFVSFLDKRNNNIPAIEIFGRYNIRIGQNVRDTILFYANEAKQKGKKIYEISITPRLAEHIVFPLDLPLIIFTEIIEGWNSFVIWVYK